MEKEKPLISKIKDICQFVDEMEDIYTWIADYTLVKEHLRYMLINYTANEDLLKEIPHKQYLDLAIVFYLSLENNMTIQINNRMAEQWNIGIDQLYHDTDSSMQKYRPLHILDFGEMITLSCEGCFRGAAVILYESTLDYLSKISDCDIVIMPSSLHEVILCMVTPEINLKLLPGMVYEINNTCLKKQECLSNSIYLYDHKKHKIGILFQGEQL